MHAHACMHILLYAVPDTPEITSLLGVYSNRGQLEYVEITWVRSVFRIGI